MLYESASRLPRSDTDHGKARRNSPPRDRRKGSVERGGGGGIELHIKSREKRYGSKNRLGLPCAELRDHQKSCPDCGHTCGDTLGALAQQGCGEASQSRAKGFAL